MNSFVSELLTQLGGYRRLKMLIGAYCFVNSHQKLSFKFKGSKRFNCCTISLNDSDLYDMTFYKLLKKGGLFQELKNTTVEVKNICCDRLIPTFTEQTNLFLFFTKKQEQALEKSRTHMNPHLAKFG